MKKYELNTSVAKEEIGHEEGVCPYCGSKNLSWNGTNVIDGQYYYDVKCDKCNNDFREYYQTIFDGYWGYPLK